MAAKFNKETIKNAAEGRWPEILAALGGVDPQILDGGHHPCPRCGGNDRFNLSRDGSGGAFCNQCFTSKNGDGLATLQWMTGQDFATTIAAIGEYLGVKPESKKKQSDPAEHLEFLPWSPTLVGLWCLKKKPIKPEAVAAIGGRVARYRKQYSVIAIPIWGPSLQAVDPVGWVIYRCDGQDLPKWSGNNKEPEWVKVKLTAGSQPGLIGNLDPAGDVIWKTEGPTDLLGLLSIATGVSAFTTANGAKEKPVEWILKRCEGKTVYVVHDADKPGQEGATLVPQRDGRNRPGWCPRLATVASEVRNVTLPFDIQDVHGKDLRDFFAAGYSFDDLLARAKDAAVFGSVVAKLTIEEDEDDPHRLARVNLERYRSEHDGRLVYWRDEWWKWKDGRYRKIETSELKAKVWASVRSEFEACWAERKNKAIKKVTRSLVSNVIGAMESICALPSSIPMPCWLPSRTRRNYVATSNGILDLDAVFENRPHDECLLEHSPEWFSSFRLDYPFDPDAKCPTWLEYLDYSLDGDQERIDLLQEWSGYLLTNSNDHQKFLALEGEGGNGKTVYFAAMTSMLGEDNVSHVTLENFGGRFELGTTIGKAANISADAGEIDMVAEGILKQFTGGDVMQFDRKNLSPVSARPTAKLMCAWNSRPRIKDKSMGLWRRMLLVPFDKSIPVEKRVFGMDKPSFWIENGEAPGILIWSILGLHRLQQNRQFTRSRASDAAMEDYRQESNPASEFFGDYVQPGDGSIDSGRLYQLYTHWCLKSGHRALGNRQFGKEVRRFFPYVERKKVREGKSFSWRLANLIFSSDEVFGKKVDDENLF